MEENKRIGEQRRVGGEGGGDCNFKKGDQEEFTKMVTFEQSLTGILYVSSNVAL